jgi:glutamate/aspartate transport system substrate-binding protein
LKNAAAFTFEGVTMNRIPPLVLNCAKPLLAGCVLLMSLGSLPASADSPVLARIAERGQINIGYRESTPPFSYYNDQKQVAGFSIDLCNHVVEEVEKQVGKQIKVNYVPITTANRIVQVVSGGIDLECGTTTITLARLEQVGFSMPFWITGTQLVVDKSTAVKEVEDLKGKTIAVLQGSSNERALQTLSRDESLNLKFNYVKDYAEGFLALETNRVDALAGDGTPIAVFAATKARQPDKLAVVGRTLTVDPYGVMFARGDEEFRIVVDRALARAFSSGAAMALLKTHFGAVGIEANNDIVSLYRSQSLPE